MTGLRIVVADDEPLAVGRLKDLINELGDVELVGTASNGIEALEVIRAETPDLVLLDVEMPKMDGFDVVETLARDIATTGAPSPLICLVTAYPQFASEAFDNGALDFLCKPVRLSRLELCVARARRAIEARDATQRLAVLSNQLDRLRALVSPDDDRFIWIHRRNETIRIDIKTIRWIGAKGEYVQIHLPGQSYLMRRAITGLAEELEVHDFIRIHRSCLVNGRLITAIKSSRAGMSVEISGEVELPIGRKFLSRVRDYVEKSAAVEAEGNSSP